MKDWVGDAIGAVCLFAIFYLLFLFGYGMGW